ncbi:MAG: class I SAM-dependent methyltransferase [Acidimicrobiia bacterium]
MTIESPPPDWYRPLASHLKEAYLKYSFTYGTAQEVEFLFEALELQQGMRLLDVGAGPGRHAVEFAKRGIDVVAIDISPEFAAIARTRATEAGVAVSVFEMDARRLPFENEFDAVMSVCEGAFGLAVDDLAILRGMTRALRSGRRLAVCAINVFYVLKHMRESGEFDPATMLFKETMRVKGAKGDEQFEMWNSCFTPRELEWIANGAGIDPEGVYGISPGEYAKTTPSFDHPELLLLARKP